MMVSRDGVAGWLWQDGCAFVLAESFFWWWIFGFSRWGARAGSEVLMKSSFWLRCALVNGFVTFHVFEIGRGYSDG